MSDYTDFTYLDYHNSDEGQRRVDSDAIGRAFSQAGASYYGDGSEFIVGYDANGGAMIDSDAVRAAARRKAEEAAESRRAEESFMRLLMQQRQAQASFYIYHGRDKIYYLREEDRIYWTQLLHKSGSCPYLFDSAKIGPFLNEMEAVVRTFDRFDVNFTSFCPYCFRQPDTDDAWALKKANAILAALKRGKWKKEYFEPPAPPANAARTAAPAKKASPAKPAIPKEKVTPTYKKEGSSLLLNRPEKGSLAFKNYEVEVFRDIVWLNVDFVSPLSMQEDSYLSFTHSLKVSYVKSGLFGSKTVSVLPGELTAKNVKVYLKDKQEGGGYACRVNIPYRKSELKALCGAGHYTIEVMIDDESFDGKRQFRGEADMTPGNHR